MRGMKEKKVELKEKHLLIQEDDFKCGKLKLWNVAKRDEDKWKNLCTGCGKKAKYETTTDWEKKMLSDMKKKKVSETFFTPITKNFKCNLAWPMTIVWFFSIFFKHAFKIEGG